MHNMFSFILFIAMLLSVVTVHEFGHFIAAKLFNVYVFEFSIGMGKLLYTKKGKETSFSIRLLPIGGYCSLAGDNETELEKNDDIQKVDVPFERTLNGVAKWKKIIILLAGVFMNFLLALFIVAGVYLSYGQSYVAPKPIIKDVIANSPAENVGLKSNDEILKVTFENGYSIKPATIADVSDFFLLYESGDITLDIKRDGKNEQFVLTPAYEESSERYYIGIHYFDYELVDVNCFNCFVFAYNYLAEMLKIILTTLIGLFRGVGLNNISGPIGIYQATDDAVSQGPTYYFLLSAIFALNVGCINLLPIPALDGGRTILTLVEAIIKKPLSKKLEALIMTISIVIVLGLMLLGIGMDIFRLLS